MTKKLTEQNCKIVINGVEITDIIYDNVSLDRNFETAESSLSFLCHGQVPTPSKGSEVVLTLEKEIEFKGKLANSFYDDEKDVTIFEARDRVKPPKMKWAFEFVNNWGGGVIVVLALVCNKEAGLGFIVFNFGFYVYRTEAK